MAAGALIRTSRLRKGVSQAELARRARTSQSAVARIEAGRTSPTIETLERLAGALGLRLVLDGTEADSGVDRTLVAAALRRSPAQRLRRMTQAVRSIERMRTGAG